MKSNTNYDEQISILLVGQVGSGKTQLQNCYVNNSFNENIKTTIAINYSFKTIELNEKSYKIRIYDASGDKLYSHIIQDYLGHSDGIMLVYDMNDEKSINHLNYWKQILKEKVNQKKQSLLLVGTKSDLVEADTYSNPTVDSISTDLDISQIQTSAKINHNIQDAFQILLEKIIQKNVEKNYQIFPFENQLIQHTFIANLIMVGSVNVGKTCLTQCFQNKYYNKNQEPTIGSELMIKKYYYDNNCIQLNLWDTSGQERYHSLCRQYFQKADRILLVYDLSNPESMDSLLNYVKIAKQVCQKDIQFVLVGNKCDLSQDDIKVDKEMQQNFADKLGTYYVEASAKLALNVDSTFYAIIKDVYDQKKLQSSENQQMEKEQQQQVTLVPFNLNQKKVKVVKKKQMCCN